MAGMNDILQLKGRFEQRSNNTPFGSPKLGTGAVVQKRHLERLRADLISLERYWSEVTILEGALLSIYYNKIVAKSNRIDALMSLSREKALATIVGAKFNNESSKHIITHFIPLSVIQSAIKNLEKVIQLMTDNFGEEITAEILNKESTFKTIDFKRYGIAKTKFLKTIVDASYVENFSIETSEFNPKKNSIVTLYETNIRTVELLKKFGINIMPDRILNETTVLLDEEYLEVLKDRAPYLVAMAIEDFSLLSPDDFKEEGGADLRLISAPTNEPTIGVIDTLFDESVYFSEWVDYHKMIDENIPIESRDYNHGTAVSSIIVDGHTNNPQLDDGCGRFKVRHFGVATHSNFSSFSIIKTIKNIIAMNKDIKVWNLSLGSNEEVNKNFISAEGAVLDQIQFENDIIFVIAGTNKSSTEPKKKIGAPADSINSVIVNSVDLNQTPTKYSREGIVLSFFAKPDVSYYGGSPGNYLTVCEPLGVGYVAGTSYAAPWISRKLSYLIDVMGLSKEIAKALLIDAAIGWETKSTKRNLAYKGHGVVPIKIDDITRSLEDEIKFVVSGISEKFDTYNYHFPVPMSEDKYPFIAKATLCYFPKCTRNQGVDYTNTELDLYFGRIKNDGKILSINENKQSVDDEIYYLLEENARKQFRKWDNVKHINEVLKSSHRAKKAYDNKNWGMSIRTKERLDKKDGEGIRFGVVVTLKEINGVNRIEDFIHLCGLRGWLVNRINVENRIDIFEAANESIEWE